MGNGKHNAYRAIGLASPAGPPANDAGGVDAFFRQQYPRLVHFLRRRGRVEAEAEDVAQESFTRLLPYVEQRSRDTWKPMLYRIAFNVVNDQLRRDRVRKSDETLPLDQLHLASDARDMEDMMVLAQQQDLLCQVIARLPPQCRRVYLLKLVRGMTNPEIARHCGISVRMVDKHLARAVLQIRQRLSGAEANA